MAAILGAPIAKALHLPTSVFFGMFSGALLLSAMVGPPVGRLIDRHGGRHLLAASNLVIAAGLLILGTAHSSVGLVVAWTMLGVGIGMGLYDPAFAALTWLYGREARSSMSMGRRVVQIVGSSHTFIFGERVWLLARSVNRAGSGESRLSSSARAA